CRVSFGSTVVV
ncbi:hypothetical protein D030_0612B, partial [Vibrio parahaemolyticus AQ3810]